LKWLQRIFTHQQNPRTFRRGPLFFSDFFVRLKQDRINAYRGKTEKKNSFVPLYLRFITIEVVLCP